ncbi:LPP20 family lipoprotein [bacterium]|nr:LPP20 family lipoprotein [bacterium]
MNKKSLIWGVVITVILMVSPLLFAQGYVQDVGGTGRVDWSNQVIKCTGIGAPNPNDPVTAQRAGALRAAKLDALRNILETVKGITLSSETEVRNAMIVDDNISSRIRGAIRGFRVVDTRYMSTGDVEVDVEVPITGVMSDALLPHDFGGGVLMTGGQLLCPVCGQPWPAGKPVPAGVELIRTGGNANSNSSAVYTGLIIDARGLNVRPAMAPKLIDPQGNEIYGSKYVSRDYAVDIGMVGYDKDVNSAVKNERVADNPLVVKALDVKGPNKTDLVISEADAKKIHNAASNMNFLQRCKVMFILQ